ncbi:hypothetical protein Glove_168g155 [Diversispora epigaea]|uniref:Uncharacterized protein n=1 Tax=Diversispora epigaea TaxID=1348612 RepID=A0A397IZ87_9GLOM|nr:hypothetical protein Glove_168g155 [Diversispora epigaea]
MHQQKCNEYVSEDFKSEKKTMGPSTTRGPELNLKYSDTLPTDIKESNEYINRTPHYILRLYGPLINGQKAVVTITGIKVFFDICILDNIDIYLFEAEIKNIFANEKDDKEKVVGDYHSVEDLSTINNLFPTSAMIHNRTLVLTWDVETHTKHGLGQLHKLWHLMICMTIYQKDDPKPLKQICFVDIKTEPDPCWITIMCENQTNILKAFALCWQALASNIVIVEKANQLHILDWM